MGNNPLFSRIKYGQIGFKRPGLCVFTLNQVDYINIEPDENSNCQLDSFTFNANIYSRHRAIIKRHKTTI